jgi:hypothetical protein
MIRVTSEESVDPRRTSGSGQSTVSRQLKTCKRGLSTATGSREASPRRHREPSPIIGAMHSIDQSLIKIKATQKSYWCHKFWNIRFDDLISRGWNECIQVHALSKSRLTVFQHLSTGTSLQCARQPILGASSAIWEAPEASH